MTEVHSWARQGNADPIPANKLEYAPHGGLTQLEVDARVALLIKEHKGAPGFTNLLLIAAVSVLVGAGMTIIVEWYYLTTL